MTQALPKVLYRDPAEALSRMEAGEVYRRERCVACANFDSERNGDPCRLRLQPGRHWCKGFDER